LLVFLNGIHNVFLLQKQASLVFINLTNVLL
jgi:hypothetical protein